MVDLSRISSRILQENFLALLGFPAPSPIVRGYIPVRVIAREFFYLMYDPIREGQITAKVAAGAGLDGITDLGFTSPARLASTTMTGKPFNIFFVKEPRRMYQLFFGIAPSALRVLTEAPAATGQRNLEIDRWAVTKLQFGWIDGFDSALLNPSPNSEIIVPPEFEFALGYGNPLPDAVDPLLLWIVNHIEAAVILDTDLVKKMLDGIVPVAIKTVGGLTRFDYDARKIYGIDPIPLGATREEVERALKPAR